MTYMIWWCLTSYDDLFVVLFKWMALANECIWWYLKKLFSLRGRISETRCLLDFISALNRGQCSVMGPHICHDSSGGVCRNWQWRKHHPSCQPFRRGGSRCCQSTLQLQTYSGLYNVKWRNHTLSFFLRGYINMWCVCMFLLHPCVGLQILDLCWSMLRLPTKNIRKKNTIWQAKKTRGRHVFSWKFGVLNSSTLFWRSYDSKTVKTLHSQ